MKKTELLNIQKDEKDLQKMIKRWQALKSKAYSPNGPHTPGEPVGKQGPKDNILIDDLIDLEDTIKAKRADIEQRKQRAARIFDRLDPERRQIMKLYYIAGLSWSDIVDIMQLSPASIYRKRQEAIILLSRPIEKYPKK